MAVIELNETPYQSGPPPQDVQVKYLQVPLSKSGDTIKVHQAWCITCPGQGDNISPSATSCLAYRKNTVEGNAEDNKLPYIDFGDIMNQIRNYLTSQGIDPDTWGVVGYYFSDASGNIVSPTGIKDGFVTTP